MERITIHVCRCCGHTATVIWQESIVPGRSLVQLECHTPGCENWMTTLYERDVEQVSGVFLPIGVDIDEMPELVEGMEMIEQE